MISVATYTFTQSPSGGHDATSSAINTTGASAIVVFVAGYTGESAPSVSDNKSNTWTPLTEYSASLSDGRFFYCIGGTFGTGHAFTVGNGSLAYSSSVILVLSGSGAFDVANGNATGSGTNLQTGSVSPAEDNSIVITGVGHAGTGATVDSGFTLVESLDLIGGQAFGVGLGYLVQTTKGALNPKWTLATGTDLAVAAMVLKSSNAPPSAPANLAFNAVSSSSIGIEWDDVAGATSYTVQYDTVDTFDASPVSIVVSAGAAGKVVGGLAQLTQYFLRVRASNSNGDSDWAFDTGPTNQYVTATTAKQVTPGAAVHNASKIKPLFDAAKTQRVLWIGLGDSNEAHNGYGWGAGIPSALLATFGMWGQNSVSWNGPENDGDFSNAQDALAPAFYHKFGGSIGGGDASGNRGASSPEYSYRSGTTASGAPHDFTGLPTVFGGVHLPLADALTVTFDYATGMGGSTSDFITTWRDNLSSPGAIGTTHYSCGGGSQGMANASINMPAAAGRTSFDFYLGSPSGWGGDVGVTGPFFSTRAIIERTDATTGILYQTMIRYGGSGLRPWLSDAMQSAADTAYSYMIQFLASRCQGSSTTIVFSINSGLNDRTGSDPADYAANLQSVMDKCSAYAAAAGLSASNVYFILWPSHVISNPDDANLVAFRQTARDLSDANPRTCAFDFERAGMTSEVMSANQFYYDNSGTIETAHLTDPMGYDYAAGLLVSQLQDAVAAGGGDDFGGFGFGFDL